MKETIMLQIIVDGKTYTYPRVPPIGSLPPIFKRSSPTTFCLSTAAESSVSSTKSSTGTARWSSSPPPTSPACRPMSAVPCCCCSSPSATWWGRDQVERIVVEFTLSHALFLRAQGNFTLDEALLSKVEARMHELVLAALPIEKRSVDTDDAVAYFQQIGMLDKAGLLRFRISSKVNTYTLDGFTDYFYGYMGAGHQLSQMVCPGAV